MVFSKKITLHSDGHFNVIIVTDQVREFIKSTGICEGHVLIFFRHTTGAVIINEFEAGIVADLQAMFEKISPAAHDYKHHIREVDFNGHAHLRSVLMQSSVSIPILEGEMTLGEFQEILVIDDQVDQDARIVIVQVMGDI